MRMPLRGRTLALLAGSLLLTQWSLDAQSAASSSKRPLTYDVVDDYNMTITWPQPTPTLDLVLCEATISSAEYSDSNVNRTMRP